MILVSEFNKFVNDITENTSRNYKLEVLNSYKDNESVKYFLDFIYNPYIITGISVSKLNKTIRVSPENEPVMFLDTFEDKPIFEYLKEHNTGKDKDIRTVTAYRNSMVREDLHDLFDSIVTKNVQLGIDVLTINKVIPNLIPTFNVQLANKYFDNPTIVEGKEFSLTTKIDGGRIIALKQGDEVSFWTRAGQRYEGLVDLENELRSLPFTDICLDGEITLLDKGNLTSKDQYKQTMKITRRDGEKHGVKMLVFDFMPASSFEKQSCSQTYKERRRWLDLLPEMTYFEVLPVLYQGKDTNEIIKWLNYNIEHGEEGVMINMVDDYYQFKRSNSLLKVKKMNDLDLPVLDFEEGTNRHTGKLGAIVTEYKGCKLKVGSGFSDELREKIWNNKEDYRGLTMVVQYFEETTNQQGGVSLRFPVFLDFRTDK